MESAEEYEIKLLIITGMFGMFLLAVSFITFLIFYQKRIMKQQLKLQQLELEHKEELLRNSINTLEKERKRIARDLHDNFGVSLSVVKLYLYDVLKKKSNPVLIDESIGNTNELLDDIIEKLRHTAHHLLPPEFSKIGLIDSIEQLLEKIEQTEDIEIDFHYSDKINFDFNTDLSIYRIVQECINNTLKHAHATLISINIYVLKDRAYIKIQDNGQGFDRKQLDNGKSMGLQNLENRARMIKADISIKSKKEKGTCVELSLNYPTKPVSHETPKQYQHHHS